MNGTFMNPRKSTHGRSSPTFGTRGEGAVVGAPSSFQSVVRHGDCSVRPVPRLRAPELFRGNGARGQRAFDARFREFETFAAMVRPCSLCPSVPSNETRHASRARFMPESLKRCCLKAKRHLGSRSFRPAQSSRQHHVPRDLGGTVTQRQDTEFELQEVHGTT